MPKESDRPITVVLSHANGKKYEAKIEAGDAEIYEGFIRMFKLHLNKNEVRVYILMSKYQTQKELMRDINRFLILAGYDSYTAFRKTPITGRIIYRKALIKNLEEIKKVLSEHYVGESSYYNISIDPPKIEFLYPIEIK